VLKTLLYFDIFRYPLNATEIFCFLRARQKCPTAVSECLSALTERKQVFRFGELYSLHADDANIKRRVKGNREAEKWLKVASTRARLIAKFPYVRAVMASGSLSKGYMDETSDLDFFVVTATNRLWIARTLLVMYKRLFLFNSHKMFCVNYFVDEEHLEIEEKNLYTATELATLVPLYNESGYRSLLSANRWIYQYLPNFRHRSPVDRDMTTAPGFQKICEGLLNPIAATLDAFFMNLSYRRWRRLYGHLYAKEDFDIAFKTRRHVSKNHPNHYQKKILKLYQGKLLEFRDRFAALSTYE